MVETLLSFRTPGGKPFLNVNTSNQDNHTALDLAILKDNTAMISSLLENAEDINY